MERRTFRKLMQPYATRNDRGVFFWGGGGAEGDKEGKQEEGGRTRESSY